MTIFKLDLLVTYVARIILTKVNLKRKFTNVIFVILRYKNLYTTVTVYKLHYKPGVKVVLLLTIFYCLIVG